MTKPRTLLFCALAACMPHARFADRAILWHDRDDAPSPLPPVRHNPEINWVGARDAVFRPADRLFGLDYGVEAANVNALDEVPDSTWFLDRRRDPAAPDDQPRFLPLTVDAIARGATSDDDRPRPPYTIVEGKSLGSARGFIMRDARGVRYLVKLDPPGLPQLVTSSAVVANRLAWAAGWNVPADLLVDLAPDELIIAPDATTRDGYGRHLPFTSDSLREVLRGQVRQGKVRALASRWIDGRILGWFDYLGRDKNDANDRIAHEDRRELRGFGVWAAWVDDVDTFENNTLDSYVGEPGRGHVIHYQQDVGKVFGVFATLPVPYWMGLESYFSADRIFASFATLGLVPRPWHRLDEATRARVVERWPQLGFFDAEHFSPRKWEPIVNNPAFVRQTRRDRYWGAKRVVQFTSDELRAAISAGDYPPEVAAHLYDVLWQRRAAIARAYFADVAALDGFRLDGDRLCFDDLWVEAGLGAPGAMAYQVRERGVSEAAKPLGGSRCALLSPRPGYRIIEVRALRPGDRHFGPPVRVHLVEGTTRRNIVGIER
jgi:hypothetical protein